LGLDFSLLLDAKDLDIEDSTQLLGNTEDIMSQSKETKYNGYV